MFVLRVTVSHINLVIAFDPARIAEWGPLALLFKLLPFTELPTAFQGTPCCKICSHDATESGCDW